MNVSDYKVGDRVATGSLPRLGNSDEGRALSLRRGTVIRQESSLYSTRHVLVELDDAPVYQMVSYAKAQYFLPDEIHLLTTCERGKCAGRELYVSDVVTHGQYHDRRGEGLPNPWPEDHEYYLFCAPPSGRAQRYDRETVLFLLENGYVKFRYTRYFGEICHYFEKS